MVASHDLEASIKQNSVRKTGKYILKRLTFYFSNEGYTFFIAIKYLKNM